MFTDSHCHLDPDVYGGEAGVDEVIERAREAGVTRMITIGSGYEPPCIERARDVAERHDGVWFTAGVHPHDAKHWTDEIRDLLADLARHPKFVAMGEMGLDFHYDNSPRERQREVFRLQIRLAREVGRPIVIHDRESEGETLRILVDERAFPDQGGPGVLYHCYTGDVVHMQEITERGGWISIPGIVTFNSAGVMRDVARLTPADRLLVETDSPFLTPVPFRGKKNEPARVALVAAKVAELRNMPVEDLAALTSRNTTRFFGLA